MLKACDFTIFVKKGQEERVRQVEREEGTEGGRWPGRQAAKEAGGRVGSRAAAQQGSGSETEREAGGGVN